MAARKSPFDASTLKFLRELRANNDRDWFNANKPRYEEHVLDPALRFIDAMYDPLADVAPRFTAIPKRSGGSLMRVYRDTRFSRDKTPYKTNIGIQFRHEFGRDVHAPGYYIHIEPDNAFIGAGMWRPAADPLALTHRRQTGCLGIGAGRQAVSPALFAGWRIAEPGAARLRQRASADRRHQTQGLHCREGAAGG